jgi:hypothetical protein
LAASLIDKRQSLALRIRRLVDRIEAELGDFLRRGVR